MTKFRVVMSRQFEFTIEAESEEEAQRAVSASSEYDLDDMSAGDWEVEHFEETDEDGDPEMTVVDGEMVNYETHKEEAA